MDECMLNDLLECSVCLERLDTSSKVLPCQHTFCRKCLQDIVETNKELRCPECRVLVEIKIEELPPNVLLMRILEGMRNAAPKKQQVRGPVRVSHGHGPPSVMHYGTPVHHRHPQGTPDRHVPNKQTPIHHPHQPYAKAVYDYISKEPGDLSFKKGDVIMLRKRIDTHWYHGESNGKQGVFPLTYVQIMTPMVSHSPQCKALYDFRMTNDDEEGCLTFNKGEVISVIRRVDENWAEGKLDDRIGIFPLAFVELNSLARSLMKLSTNSQPGPSRVAPPTPTAEDSTPLILTDHSQHISTTVPANQQQHQHHHHQHAQTNSNAPSGGLPASDSSSTVSSGSSSTTTPNTTSSNTSSSSSTAPSSPASPPPPGGQTTPARNAARHTDVSSATSIPQHGINIINSPPPRPNVHCSSKSSHQHQREKRHSFTSLNSSQHHQSTHRHSAEIVSPDVDLNHGNDRHRRSGDTGPPLSLQQASQLSSTVHLPAAYIALYPYVPQKADELELRKSGIYMVTERCQDGWFKGTSNRTQKCGVFPGNYVTLARSVPKVVASSGSQAANLRPGESPSMEPKITMSYTRGSKNASPRLGQNNMQPPELPPRSVSPCTGTSTISSSWHEHPEATAAAPLGRSQSAVMASGVASPPTAMIGSSATVGKQVDRTKERKEKSTVSLMRRLTSIKKPKSPPPASYSMDNPVFEDATAASSNVSHSVHVRSGSCPSQLLQVQPAADGSTVSHRLFGSGSSSQRVKHKERTNVILANLSYNARNSEHSATGGPSSSPNISQHRKSNSLDAGSKSSKNMVVSSERFRCIVPYPPNTEYELELQMNDIIYVHKKRDDGWYKGTLQRTGRTGLFPASFVESF
ncbi:Plenty of SH3s [Carabus blaptoides fortunei]